MRFGKCKGDSDIERGRWVLVVVGVSSSWILCFLFVWWLWEGCGFGSSVVVVVVFFNFWSWGGVKVLMLEVISRFFDFYFFSLLKIW